MRGYAAIWRHYFRASQSGTILDRWTHSTAAYDLLADIRFSCIRPGHGGDPKAGAAQTCGEAGVTFQENYKGFEVEFASDGKLVLIRCLEGKVLDRFDTNRSGCRDELRALAHARIDEELGG